MDISYVITQKQEDGSTNVFITKMDSFDYDHFYEDYQQILFKQYKVDKNNIATQGAEQSLLELEQSQKPPEKQQAEQPLLELAEQSQKPPEKQQAEQPQNQQAQPQYPRPNRQPPQPPAGPAGGKRKRKTEKKNRKGKRNVKTIKLR